MCTDRGIRIIILRFRKKEKSQISREIRPQGVVADPSGWLPPTASPVKYVRVKSA